MAEVVEAVAGLAIVVGEVGVVECWLPVPTVEVRRVQGAAAPGLEEQLLGCVGAVFDCAGGERLECSLDGGKTGTERMPARLFGRLSWLRE